MAKYMKKRRRVRRKMMRDRLGGVCQECGTTKRLEFDHVDPSTKEFTISTGLDKPLEVLKAEVDKCQLLCYKHHLEKSRQEDDLGGGQNKIEPTCGTPHSYQCGCRCDKCKLAKKLYRHKKITYHDNIADYPIKANGLDC